MVNLKESMAQAFPAIVLSVLVFLLVQVVSLAVGPINPFVGAWLWISIIGLAVSAWMLQDAIFDVRTAPNNRQLDPQVLARASMVTAGGHVLVKSIFVALGIIAALGARFPEHILTAVISLGLIVSVGILVLVNYYNVWIRWQ